MKRDRESAVGGGQRIPFQVLLTADERDVVDEAAARKGLSRSAFFRFAALETVRRDEKAQR